MESTKGLSSVSAILKQESNLGLFCRLGLFGLVMFAGLGLAYFTRLSLSPQSVSSQELWAMFFAAIFPMGASLILGERPRGEDWIMLRLALATFCRTGLPLFFVVVITLVSKKQLQPTALGFLAFFYILGILVVVWISINRLSETRVGSDNNDEVDRAPDI